MPPLEYSNAVPGANRGGTASARSIAASVGGVAVVYVAEPSPSDGMPLVWVARCRSVTPGVVAASSGTQRASGSSRVSAPASRSCSSAVAVTSLVIEPIR